MMIGSACIPSSCGGRCSSYRPRGGVFEWPRRRRAAEQRDELASFQLIELHLVPPSQGRISGYRIGSGQSGGSQSDVRVESMAPLHHVRLGSSTTTVSNSVCTEVLIIG